MESKEGLRKVPKFGMDTDLEELMDRIRDARRSDEIKKDVCSQRVLAMLSRLYDGYSSEGFVPRKIHTVGELYTFRAEETQQSFRGYGKKTWEKLDEVLARYGLPKLRL